jgi:hypothetical protein
MFGSSGRAIVEGHERLATGVAGLDPHALTPREAAGLLGELVAIEKLAAGARTLIAARATEDGAWRRAGCKSRDEWLGRKTGTSTGRARKTLEASEKLDDLADTADALRRGELSDEQASAVIDAAGADPSAEGQLLDLARGDGDVGHLKDTCRRTKRNASGDPEARRRRIHAKRSLRCWDDDEGARHLHLMNNPEVVAEVEALLKPFTDAEFKRARKEGRRESIQAYAADALLAMARAAHEHADADTDSEGVDDGGSATSGVRPPKETILLASLDALRRGRVEDSETCEIDGVGPISVPAALDHLGEGLLSLVITDGVDVQNVTVLGRHWTREQRTALIVRDRECVRPGCHRTHRLDIHHTVPYEQTLHCRVDEAGRVCKPEHRLLTTQGHDVQRRPDGTWHWTTPDDTS